MRTHRRSGLLISKIALEKLFRYLINCAGVTRQNLVSSKSRFWSHSQIEVKKLKSIGFVFYNGSDSKIVISKKQDFVESHPRSLLDI